MELFIIILLAIILVPVIGMIIFAIIGGVLRILPVLLAWCAILLAGSIILVGFYLLHEWITPYLNSHLSYETRYSLSEIAPLIFIAAVLYFLVDGLASFKISKYLFLKLLSLCVISSEYLQVKRR